MGEKLQENKKRFEDIKERTEFEKYLHSITETEKDCQVYEKAYENIKILRSDNSILLISMDKSKEAYIVSMHKKHKKAFEYENEFCIICNRRETKGKHFLEV